MMADDETGIMVATHEMYSEPKWAMNSTSCSQPSETDSDVYTESDNGIYTSDEKSEGADDGSEEKDDDEVATYMIDM